MTQILRDWGGRQEINSKLYEARLPVFIIVVLYVTYQAAGWLYRGYLVRVRYHEIISLPRNPIWGNLINCGPRLSPLLKQHPDYGLEQIWQELGSPGCFLLDFAPIFHGILIVAEPQYIEPLIQPREDFKYSLPKSDTYEALKPLIGYEGMITKEGADWKALRKRFNPGFQPRHIHSLSGSVVSKTGIFVERLRAASERGTIFRLAEYAKDLTTDIITELTIAQDLHAQSTPEGHGEKSRTGLLTASRRLSELIYSVGQGVGLYMIDPVRAAKEYYYTAVLDRKLTALVTEQAKSSTTDADSLSITELAIADLPLSNELIRSCVDQIKSFLFAGQDTTATLIQWMYYHMSKARYDADHAIILSKLRQEHDEVFGPDPFSAQQVLSQQDTEDSESILTSKLPYTTAFIKETLRLHPPAATTRRIPDDAIGVTIPLPQPVCIAGLRVYPSQHLIHRNPKIWGPDAHEFKPDRWLDDAYIAALPAGAYRPFERGPRNCIGQELAMLEGRVALVCVARGFVFEKVGLTGQDVNKKGEREREVWSSHAVTSVPVDGMVMRVKLREDVNI
jgi:cytochrome P450